jgi:RNA polymerase sigma-70 factor (ECF subfamily)
VTGSPQEALIEKAVAGDRPALEQLLLAHHDPLAAYIRLRLCRRLSSVSDDEDILHKTYVKAFRGIASFAGRSGESFSAWLRTIARHQIADDLKRRRNERRSPERPKEGGSSWILDLRERVVDRTDTPSKEVARREAVRAMQVALAALPDSHRQAIWLRYLQGLSLEESAKRMGRSLDSVRGLCARGRQRLREILGRASAYLSG